MLDSGCRAAFTMIFARSTSMSSNDVHLNGHLPLSGLSGFVMEGPSSSEDYHHQRCRGTCRAAHYHARRRSGGGLIPYFGTHNIRSGSGLIPYFGTHNIMPASDQRHRHYGRRSSSSALAERRKAQNLLSFEEVSRPSDRQDSHQEKPHVGGGVVVTKTW